MLKTVIICAIGVCLFVTANSAAFAGIEIKSSKRDLTDEEPPANVNQRTSEGRQDDNYKGNKVLKQNSDAADSVDNGEKNDEVESNLETESSERKSPDDGSSVNVKQGTSKGGRGAGVLQTDARLKDSDDANFAEDVKDYEEIKNIETDGIDNFTCGSLPEIEEATSPDLDGDEHAIGTVAKYYCRIGYVSRIPGGFSSFCEINETSGRAEWTQPAISCIPRSCGNPGYVTNARRVGNLFTFPNKIEFVCDEGYKLKGVKSRYCEASGRWSGRQPTCDVINCTAPTDPVNGRVSYSSLEYGSELRYKCNRGFVLQNDETRVCSADGKWSNNEPECVEARCDNPPSPSRGSVYLSGQPTVGTLAMYSCDQGTTLVGSSTSKCLENGIWTFDPPKCLRSCEIPVIGNGTLGWFKTVKRNRINYQEFTKFQVGKTLKHDESAVLSCNQGFSPVSQSTVLNDGTDEVSCNDGEWSKPLQCKTLSCLEDPPPMENGKAVVDSRLHGTVIWYTCNPGLKKMKSGHVECDYGTWKGYTPVCGDDRCHTNQLNYPGLEKPHPRYFPSKSTLVITCEEGYEKTSLEDEITCLLGLWEIENNPCTLKKAEHPTTTEAIGSSPSPAASDNCYCTYDYPSYLVASYAGNKPLNAKDKIKKDETVTLSCRQSGMHLMWRNTVLLTASVNVTCNPCENWTQESLPTCVFVQEKVERLATTEAPRSSSSPPVSADICYCTYDYDSYYIAAHAGNKPLNAKDKIKKGESITLTCRQPGMHLTWRNGLSFYGAVNLTCNPCRNWTREVLPTCISQIQGASFLLFNNDMKILPEGIIEVPKRKNISFHCINFYGQPIWNPSNKIGTNVVREETYFVDGHSYYRNFLKMYDAREQLAGVYDCYYWANGHAFVYTRLIVKIVDYEMQCPELETNTQLGKFKIVYEDGRRINSVAHYSCKSNSEKLIGASRKICLANGKWSRSSPFCENITCPYINLYNSLRVNFTNRRFVNSVAKFRCDRNLKLIGENSLTCLATGEWSSPKMPTCEMPEIRCPDLDEKGIFSIYYDNGKKIGSFAQFYCKSETLKVSGCSFMTCEENGEWSGDYPTCVGYLNCNRFETSAALKVFYSNDIKIGSVATFSCSVPYTLVGSDRARCLPNGNWDHALPSCKEYLNCNRFESSDVLKVSYSNDTKIGSIATFSCAAPYTLVGSNRAGCKQDGTWNHALPSCEASECSIDNLMLSLPETVFPDMREVKGDLVPQGTELQFRCEENSVLSGSSKTLCGANGRWEHEAVTCTQGCVVNKAISPYLLVDPVKEHYIFGESVSFSCLPGRKLNSDVQRTMCLGTDWSDSIPGCIEAPPESDNSKNGRTMKSG